MRRSRRDVREDLRLAVRCLPQHTRVAMLEGVQRNDIIVGAYTDRKGGVCPMLAAHRCGGRTDFLAFAHSWDRFTNELELLVSGEPEAPVADVKAEAHARFLSVARSPVDRPDAQA